jgi:hypothetical protein
MDEIRFTLVSDGSSDRTLLPILTWVLRELSEINRIQPEWADLRRLHHPPRSLRDRILISIDLYPCDLLFIHRDAEGEDPEHRYEEISSAISEAENNDLKIPAICVVPVRMTEAWLLIDESSIRRAAGNPNGKEPLHLPEVSKIEQIPNPKEVLFNKLRKASGLSGRHLKSFDLLGSRIRVSDLVEDFSPLRKLMAFQRLENDIRLLKKEIWNIM